LSATAAAKPKRGEVWQVQLDPTIGSELQKSRPVVVMSTRGVGRPTVRVCVPITGWQPAHDALPWYAILLPSKRNGLGKQSSADASQVRALDVARFIDRLGILEGDDVSQIAATIALCIGFEAPEA
jgi:mRNA interferase MazF